MFELDRHLAQDIVDRAMAILPYNVNVMDRQGVIIGSGDVQRVDSLHEGAQLVLANQRVVALDEQAAACLPLARVDGCRCWGSHASRALVCVQWQRHFSDHRVVGVAEVV